MTAAAPNVIEVQELQKVFRVGFWGRRVIAVQDVSLTVRQGEVFGLVGPNGAGKSTTLKMLMGFVRPNRGRGQLLGFPLGDRRARQRLGYLPELPMFPRYLTALEVLDFHAGLAGVRGDPSWSQRRSALLERVGLARAARTRLATYSKGMLQRCGLAVALCSEPDLLVLDEPMSGLDPLGRHDVRRIIREEAAAGRTVLFSSHVLSDVESLCQQVAILSQGRVFRAGGLADLTASTTCAVEVRFSLVTDEALASLQRLGPVRQTANTWSMELKDEQEVQQVLRAALALNAQVHSVAPRSSPLEDLLLQAQAQPRTAGRTSP